MPYIVFAAVVVVLLFLLTIRRVTVFEGQRGIKYSRGRLSRILEPGQYWILKPWTAVRMIDVRPVFVSVAGQEVLSADGVTLRVSLAAKYEVADPERAVTKIQDYQNAAYLILQMAAREVIGAATIDELMEKRGELAPRLVERASPAMAEIGITLLSADIKDIMLPGETKKLFAQIVKARKEGLAALEKARGETAALRNLANAAAMMEDHPSLLQLRALQQLAESTGSTLVIGVPADAALPTKRKSGQVAEGEPEPRSEP